VGRRYPSCKARSRHLLIESGVIERHDGAGLSFSDPKVFDPVFLRETKPAVVALVQPLKMNERATSQRGLFLCPNNLRFGFEFALKQVLKSDRDRTAQSYRENYPNEEPHILHRLFKIYIEPQARSELMRELDRMNINYATLFPGLDGFAKSLGINITISGFEYAFAGGDFDSFV
jgi:hypothetical protein